MQYSTNNNKEFKISSIALALVTAYITFHTTNAISNEVPPGFFKTPDGTILANNPKTAVAPPGYYLRRNGALIKVDPDLAPEAPVTAAATMPVNMNSDEVPDGFHKMPNGQIMANDPANAIVPPGYHMMPNGVLMANNTGQHGAGMWMFDFKYSYMSMKDMLDTTNKLTADLAVKDAAEGGYGYMMAPVDMSMHMAMAMVMYGVTDKFMLMGMGHYMKNNMTMLTRDDVSSTMSSSGISDTVISGMLQIPYKLTLNIGLSIPTGDINVKGPMTHGKEDNGNLIIEQNAKYPYGMQLGSGSWDIKHGISYADVSGDIGWGGSYEYTSRMNKNSNDYKWGNLFLVDTWIRWDITKEFNTTAKLAFRGLGEMEGADPELPATMSPTMDSENYGGRRLDLGLGAKYTISEYSVTTELSMPVYQNLWGPQMATKWVASINFGAMF